MKKNSKGFTVVELLASFSLTMIIVVFLFEILIELKDLYYEAGIKTEVVQKESMLVSKIRNKLDTSELIGIDCSGDTCTFKFADTDPVQLTIDASNKTIIYDEDKVKFPDEVKFKQYNIGTCSLNNGKPDNDLGLLEGTTAKNCYITLNIVISSARLDKEYPINIVYPYTYDPTFVNGDFQGSEDLTGTKEKYICEGSQKTYTVKNSGTYKIELLGASGGASNNGKIAGGLGAYTSGEIYLNAGETLYLNVGCAGSKTSSGTSASTAGGYNGGGNGTTATSGIAYAGGGGGATDIRIGGTGINNRIMVAAGGSGAGNGSDAHAGTPGGALASGNSNNVSGPKGATQTSGGKAASGGKAGTFGVGAAATTLGGGGGGGYYGGAGGISVSGTGTSGTGGSSYISGMLGSNSITSNSSVTPTNKSNHFSGRVFYNTLMYSGDKVPSDKTSESFYNEMPTELQSPGDGYAIITYESSSIPTEALNLSGSKANYDLSDALVWLDGHDNVGTGIHDYTKTSWHNLTGGNHMALTKTAWNDNGLDLSSTGNIVLNATTGFTMSTVITLNSYPSSLQRITQGKLSMYINAEGKVGFNNGTTDVLFDYAIKNLNIKEYLTVVGTGTTVTLYANGKSVSSKNLTTKQTSNTTITLPGTLSGTLHKLMIFGVPKSAEDVENIYNEDNARFGAKFYNLPNKNVEYDFSNENYNTTGKTIIDISGNDNTATVEGTMTIKDKGLVLDGTNNIKLKGDVNYRYSLLLIVSASSLTGTNPSLIGNSTYPDLYLNSSNSYKYSFKSQGLNSSFNSSLKTGKKEFIVLTYNGSNVTLYVDGIKRGSLATTTDPASVTNAYIGKNFKGNIHKYALYDRTLTEKEIRTLYEYDFNEFS